jgi:hypothetical protein
MPFLCGWWRDRGGRGPMTLGRLPYRTMKFILLEAMPFEFTYT